MRQRLVILAIAFLVIAMGPIKALADEKEPYDGRLEGYSKSVTLDGGGTALMWLLLIALSVVVLGVLFKNARRSHLD